MSFKVTDNRFPIGSVSRREIWNASQIASTNLGDLNPVEGSILQFDGEKWVSGIALPFIVLDQVDKDSITGVNGKIVYDDDNKLYLYTEGEWVEISLEASP